MKTQHIGCTRVPSLGPCSRNKLGLAIGLTDEEQLGAAVVQYVRAVPRPAVNAWMPCFATLLRTKYVEPTVRGPPWVEINSPLLPRTAHMGRWPGPVGGSATGLYSIASQPAASSFGDR